MANKIPHIVIEEGHVRAVKDTDDFGGPNMWQLYVKDARGHFRSTQWMSVGNIQDFFKQKLPQYKKNEKSTYTQID